MLVNWFANTILTLTFPYLAKLLQNYVFIVFTVIVGFAVLVIFKKVPETKGKTVEEIMAKMNGVKGSNKYKESSGKLMKNSSVWKKNTFVLAIVFPLVFLNYWQNFEFFCFDVFENKVYIKYFLFVHLVFQIGLIIKTLNLT